MVRLLLISAFSIFSLTSYAQGSKEGVGNYPSVFSEVTALNSTGGYDYQGNNEAAPEEDEIFTEVEKPAEFPGGMAAVMRFLASNLRYPGEAQKNDIQGRVIVKMVVEKDGSISSATVSKSVDKALDNEALRIVKKMPKWTPAQNKGVAVRSYVEIPVTFKLSN